MLTALALGYTQASFNDIETSGGSSATGWISSQWIQTSQADFASGVANDADTGTTPGNVTLGFTAPKVTVYSPTAVNGTWTNPTNAFADGGSYANILSGSPSGNQTYGSYGFNLATADITQVRVRTDAWSLGTAGLIKSQNPAANTNGAIPWVSAGNGYTSNDLYAIVSPAYGTSLSNNPAGDTGGASPWTNAANGYTSNNLYATVSPSYAGTATSQNPTVYTNGAIPWTNAANGYTSNNLYATVSPAYASTTSQNPAGNTNGASPWTSAANGYTSNNLYATAVYGTTVSSKAPAGTGATVWTNPTYAYAQDTNYATSAAAGEAQIYNNYGFSLDTTATVTRVRVNVRSSASVNDRITLSLSADGGASWLATTVEVTNTGSMTDHWQDVTAWTAWTAAKINNNQIQARVTHVRVQGADTVSLDYLPIEVTTGNVYDQIYRTFGISDPGSGSMITKVEIGYEAFASATGKLDIYTSGDGGSGWGTIHTTLNLGTSDPNTYTYIDVTADRSWTWTMLNDTNLQAKVVTNWVSGTPAWSLDALVVRVTYDDRRPYDQIYGTFGITGTIETITKVEIGYEAFASATGKLDIYTSGDGGSSWGTIHTTSNLGTSDPNAYAYIDVTADRSWTWTMLNDTNLRAKVVTNWVSGTPAWSLDALVVRVTYDGLNDEQIRVRVTWDGGSTWSSYAANSTTGTETSYWNDFTSATNWTPARLSDSNFKVSVEGVTTGDTGDVRLDWIPVEITYKQYASSGIIASPVLDTGIAGSRWDGIFWDQALPSGTNITIDVRASDTPFLKTDAGLSWTSIGSGSPGTATVTSSPTVDTGSAWTNAGGAYADGGGYANITSGTPSGNNIWGNYGFNLNGDSIAQVKVRYDAWYGTLGTSQNWVSPTSDNSNGWLNPAYAYNGNTGDYASISIPGGGTSDYLELYVDPVNCDKVRVWSDRSGSRITGIEVDVYYNSQWNNIYSGTLAVGSFQEYPIGSTQTVSGTRMRYTSSQNPIQNAYIHEVEFNSITGNSAPQIRIDVSWDGGNTWSSTQNTVLTGSETTTWYDVTTATSWDATKLNDTNLKVRAVAQTVNGDVEVRLDWLPVEVTYYTSGSMYSISVPAGEGRYKQWRAVLTPDGTQTITPTLQEVRAYYYGG